MTKIDELIEQQHSAAPVWMGPVVASGTASTSSNATFSQQTSRYAPHRVIALHGEQGVGKDTIADYLVDKYGFHKLAFADRLRQMVIEDNRVVAFELSETVIEQIQERGTTTITEMQGVRLKDAVERLGWDEAKRRYPEVRRAHGDIANKIVRPWFGDTYFTMVVTEQIASAPQRDYVISDLRQQHEWDLLTLTVVRSRLECWLITRPNSPIKHDDSIRQLESWHPPRYCPLVNDYDLDELYAKIDIGLDGGGFAAHELLA